MWNRPGLCQGHATTGYDRDAAAEKVTMSRKAWPRERSQARSVRYGHRNQLYGWRRELQTAKSTTSCTGSWA
jgi:hypothetical protein